MVDVGFPPPPAPHARAERFNSVTVDIAKVHVEDTADFALKLFATINQLRKDRKAGESASGGGEGEERGKRDFVCRPAVFDQRGTKEGVPG